MAMEVIRIHDESPFVLLERNPQIGQDLSYSPDIPQCRYVMQGMASAGENTGAEDG
jgi:hypothetical protein